MAQERCIKTVYSEISARRSPFVCQVSDIRGTCQARRKAEREGERYIGRDPIHVPSIHPDRQHSSLHVNLKVAIVSFMRYELAFVGTKYMAFAHGY